MNFLLTAATPFEIAPTQEWLALVGRQSGDYQYQLGRARIDLLISGVGLPLTAYSLGKILASRSYDLAIQAGIAGAWDRSLEIGEVVSVTADGFGDLGVEEADGCFTSVHTLGLIDPQQPPFIDGRLLSSGAQQLPKFLKEVSGTTVNRVHGYAPSIAAFQERSDAQVESMEGAAFAYACLLEQLPHLQIRSISNYVEPRDREKWNLPLAIGNLNQVIKEMIQILAAG